MGQDCGQAVDVKNFGALAAWGMLEALEYVKDPVVQERFQLTTPLRAERGTGLGNQCQTAPVVIRAFGGDLVFGVEDHPARSPVVPEGLSLDSKSLFVRSLANGGREHGKPKRIRPKLHGHVQNDSGDVRDLPTQPVFVGMTG